MLLSAPSMSAASEILEPAGDVVAFPMTRPWSGEDDTSERDNARYAEADLTALAAINTQLGNARQIAHSTLAALIHIARLLESAEGFVEPILGASSSEQARAAHLEAFQKLISLVADAVDGSSYKGQSLLGAAAGAVPGTSRSVIHDEDGSTSTLSARDFSRLPTALAEMAGCSFSRDLTGKDHFSPAIDGAQPAPAGPAALAALRAQVNREIERAEADAGFLDATITLNYTKMDRLTFGLGALMDADLSHEAARLQSLVISQELGSQSLPLTNHAPHSLLTLFK